MEIFVEKISNFPIDSNCYVIYSLEEKKCIIVDPGSRDSSELIQFIENKELKLKYIILTHEHFDHIWGVNALKDKYNCKLITSIECSANIIHRKKNLSIFFDQIGFETYASDIPFEKDIWSEKWNSSIISLYKTKGHSEGSISLMINNCLFTGDTLIKDRKTVTKLPNSNRNHLIESIKLLENLCDNQTIIYPGHGDSFVSANYNFRNAL